MFFVNDSVKLISKIVIIVTVIVLKNAFILIFVFIIFSLLYSCLNLINFIAIIGFILEVKKLYGLFIFDSYQRYLIHSYQFYSLRFLRHRSYSLKLIVKGSIFETIGVLDQSVSSRLMTWKFQPVSNLMRMWH